MVYCALAGEEEIKGMKIVRSTKLLGTTIIFDEKYMLSTRNIYT